MKTGVVKWFNNAKGYGFVIAEGTDEDIFVHYSAIDMEGYKTLKAGQSVAFELESGPKGIHATNIKCLEGEAAGDAWSGNGNTTSDQDDQEATA